MRVPLSSTSYHKLETVKINGFEDGSREIEIVKYILKNALALKKLILCYVRISEGTKMSIMDEPRASTHCLIVKSNFIHLRCNQFNFNFNL